MTQEHVSAQFTEGSVTFAWLPLVGVVVTTECPDFQLGEVKIVTNEGSLTGHFNVVQAGSHGARAVARGDVLINHTKSSTPSMKHVDVHVLNLPDFAGEAVCEGNSTRGARQRWVFGGWDLTMDPVFLSKKTRDAAQAIRGTLPTHVIRAARTDGKSFKQKHVSQLLEALHLTLSFAVGDHVGPLLAAGRNKAGDVVLEFLRTYPSFGWRPRFGPAPVYSGVGPMLESLGTIFVEPDKTIRETVWWYLEARWCMIEASVVLSQASLERLAHFVLVRNRRLLKEDAFDKLRTADNIRLMMRVLEIPTNLSTKHEMDIPDLLTTARNNQVHSKQRGKQVEAADAYRPALQTIELLLLRLAGYQGRYHPTAANHAADESIVPWVK
jgi:hypothetical protein